MPVTPEKAVEAFLGTCQEVGMKPDELRAALYTALDIDKLVTEAYEKGKLAGVFRVEDEYVKKFQRDELHQRFEVWHEKHFTQGLGRFLHTYQHMKVRARWEGFLGAHGIQGDALFFLTSPTRPPQDST